jgi:hypothetical protein
MDSVEGILSHVADFLKFVKLSPAVEVKANEIRARLPGGRGLPFEYGTLTIRIVSSPWGDSAPPAAHFRLHDILGAGIDPGSVFYRAVCLGDGGNVLEVLQELGDGAIALAHWIERSKNSPKPFPKI